MKNVYIIFAVVILMLILFLPTSTRKQKLLERNRLYQQQIIDLKKENIRLAEEKRKLQEDPEYLEKIARDKMGIVRDGEVIYRITPFKQNAVEHADGDH